MSVFQIVNQRDQMFQGRSINACLLAKLADNADLRINLGLALANGKIAPKPGMLFHAVAAPLRQQSNRGARCRFWRTVHEGSPHENPLGAGKAAGK